MESSVHSVKSLESTIISLLLELLSIMELWKGRKNRSLEELAKTMLSESSLPKYFWADVVSTACYVMNRVLIRPILKI